MLLHYVWTVVLARKGSLFLVCSTSQLVSCIILDTLVACVVSRQNVKQSTGIVYRYAWWEGKHGGTEIHMCKTKTFAVIRCLRWWFGKNKYDLSFICPGFSGVQFPWQNGQVRLEYVSKPCCIPCRWDKAPTSRQWVDFVLSWGVSDMRSQSKGHRVILPRFSYNTIAFHGPHWSCYKGVLLYFAEWVWKWYS